MDTLELDGVTRVNHLKSLCRDQLLVRASIRLYDPAQAWTHVMATSIFLLTSWLDDERGRQYGYAEYIASFPSHDPTRGIDRFKIEPAEDGVIAEHLGRWDRQHQLWLLAEQEVAEVQKAGADHSVPLSLGYPPLLFEYGRLYACLWQEHEKVWGKILERERMLRNLLDRFQGFARRQSREIVHAINGIVALNP